MAYSTLVLSFQVPDEEVSKLVSEKISTVSEIHPHFSHFSFTPRELDIQQSPSIVFAMFHHLGLATRFRISDDVLARFILMVRRGYRDPPYHNWMHAFSVAHFCFLLVTNCRLVENRLLR